MRGKTGARAEQLFRAVGKYRYVLLVALVGAALLLWPESGGGETTAPAAADEGGDLFQVARLEERLEHALSQIEGAGEVTVVLTLEEGPRRVLAENESDTDRETELRRETSPVLASGGSGTQQPVKLQELAPAYRGALVVAEGGGDARVRLAVSEAVSALTGLGADKITICKGK